MDLYGALLPLSHFGGLVEDTNCCRTPELRSSLRGGAEVVTLHCLLAKELCQEARNSGMTQRTFQKLLTGASGVYHSQENMLLGVTECSHVGRKGHLEPGHWPLLPLRVMNPKAVAILAISKRQFWKLPMEPILIIWSNWFMRQNWEIILLRNCGPP